MSWYDNRVAFATLAQKRCLAITGCEKGSERITFEVEDVATGERESFAMFHDQGCCESVRVEDVTGNVADIVGQVILMADESSNRESEPRPSEYSESWTWTFYKLATAKGYLDIRWLGESNGYYSESVEVVRV